ncbi:MAG: tetratricopeptide repeat protein [Candidatus Moraniibacteriota bacterium]|jgi:tetratricopeptide (TPR) repeat protein
MEDKKKAIIISGIAIILFGIIVGFSFVNKSKEKNLNNQGTGNIVINDSISHDLKNNKFDEAIVKIKDLLEDDADNIDLLLAKAEVLLVKGSHKFEEEENAVKAQEILLVVLEKDPENAKAYRLMGYSYEIQNMFEDALLNYNTALTFEETADTYNWIGHTFDLKGQTDVAEEFYDKAYEIDDSNRTVMRNLARIYMNTDRMANARKILEKIIKLPVDNISAVAGDYHSLGVIDFENQDIDKSKISFEKALKIDPSFMLSQVELEKNKILFTNDKEDAIINLIKISKNYPKQVFPVEWLGFAYLEINEFDNAIKTFDKAIELIEGDITLMPQQRIIIRSRLNYYLSISQALNGQTEKSKEHLLKAMEGMNETTMAMIVIALQKGKDGPYKNMIHDKDIVEMINSLNK